MHAGPAIHEVEPACLLADYSRGDLLLVDVREPDEYADEHVPGALLLPLSRFDAAALPAAPGKRLALLCLTGKRSAEAGRRLAATGLTGIEHVRGGLLAWKAAGGRTYGIDV
jgi:rhodanese-related sulfurtransferase